jgi:hypothetical protein
MIMPDFFRTLLWWIAGLAFIVWVVANPSAAGHDIHALFTGVVSFIQSLAKG